jgi:aromatic-amino-acid transaminase
MNYAPIAGLPDFQQAAIDFVFQDNQPEGAFIKAVATPGGTGAIRHIVYNYLEKGQKVLIPDWLWEPYCTIADENQRGVETYKMFDQDYKFNHSSIEQKAGGLLEHQNSIVTIFNTPAHNPTGYSMSVEDWKKIVEIYRGFAKNKGKKIVLLLDIAYIDYAGPAQKTREFFKFFQDLPENMLVAIAFSMSKSFLVYGMRSGAVIGLTSSKETAEEFFRVCSHSNRGTWSNGSRGAQQLLVDVMKNPDLKQNTDAERNRYMELIMNRADIFIKEAEEVGLTVLPYYAGFFITVPAKDPRAITDRLAGSNIFAVPMEKGVRFAICAVPTQLIPGLARKTKEAFGK